VPAAHPVVAAAYSEADCFLGYQVVLFVWATEDWSMLEILRNITQYSAVSSLKNKTKNSYSQVQVDIFVFTIFR